MTPFDEVEEFHLRFHVPIRHTCAAIAPEREALRRRLLQEEMQETIDCMAAQNLRGVADGLADLMYVIIGTGLEYGIPLAEVFREVHRSNMSKLDRLGNPIIRADGKVLKSPLFSPPDIVGILARHTHWREGGTARPQKPEETR